jgi:hypothetical protein
MNARTGLIVGIGLLLGIPAVQAHPDYTPGSCHLLERSRVRDALNLDNAEQLDFNAPLLRIGDTTVSCKADFGPGAMLLFNFANTGFTCDLGPETAPIAKTKVWTETISPSGEATLTCVFGPR